MIHYLEIPQKIGISNPTEQPSGRLLLEECKKRICVVPVHVDLAEERELHTKLGVHVLDNGCAVLRLLRAELITGKTEKCETALVKF